MRRRRRGQPLQLVRAWHRLCRLRATPLLATVTSLPLCVTIVAATVTAVAALALAALPRALPAAPAVVGGSTAATVQQLHNSHLVSLR